MRFNHKYIIRITLGFFLIIFSQCSSPRMMDEYYCSLIAGESTQTSVVIVARLQKSDTLINNDLQGIEGYIKFRITRDPLSKNNMESAFYHAIEKNDFTAKHEFTGLRPGQVYFYSISYGKDTANNTSSSWSTLKTLNLPVSEKNINFVVTNGLNFHTKIHSGLPEHNNNKEGGSHSGSGTFAAITECKPDFWVVNADFGPNFNSQESPTDTLTDNVLFHNLFANKEFNKIAQNTPFFWMFSQTDPDENDLLEKLPIGKAESHNFDRTYYLNRDVQVWMVGNLFQGISGSGPSVLNWLKTTLKESNTPFKLIISRSSILGSKSAPEMHRTEKDSLFLWLKNNGLRNNGLYFICNQAESKYHLIDPMGFEEFSCGAFSPPVSKTYVADQDTILTDPNNPIVQAYSPSNVSGGFLTISSKRDEFDSPVLLFRLFDQNGSMVYAVNKY